jgi:hypothetical protein
MRDLIDTHYPDADRIRVVLDNLSTHSCGAPHEAFPAPEAHRIFAAAQGSVTRQSTPVGSTWLKSRSACCVASAWIAAFGEHDRLVSGNRRVAAATKCLRRAHRMETRQKLARAYPDAAKES